MVLKVQPVLEFLNNLCGLGTHAVGIGLSYRSAKLHKLAEAFPLESIPRLLKSLKIPAMIGIND